uniref:Ig-like domain-containing protein n=1 Tax=Paramormyrops kingsleyae TaxID=1676925 RepID=A0A3B3RHX5_9TELE
MAKEGVGVNQLGNFHTVPAGVSTVSWATVLSGGSVTIPCSYDNMYQHQEKYWCKGWDWSSCSPKVRTNSPKISDEMLISDDPTKPVFTVTINNLRREDSGSYWCGVEISRGSAVGTRVYLSVTQGKMSVLQIVANEMHIFHASQVLVCSTATWAAVWLNGLNVWQKTKHFPYHGFEALQRPASTLLDKVPPEQGKLQLPLL